MEQTAEDLTILIRQLGQAMNHVADALEALVTGDREELQICVRCAHVDVDMARKTLEELPVIDAAIAAH